LECQGRELDSANPRLSNGVPRNGADVLPASMRDKGRPTHDHVDATHRGACDRLERAPVGADLSWPCSLRISSSIRNNLSSEDS